MRSQPAVVHDRGAVNGLTCPRCGDLLPFNRRYCHCGENLGGKYSTRRRRRKGLDG